MDSWVEQWWLSAQAALSQRGNRCSLTGDVAMPNLLWKASRHFVNIWGAGIFTGKHTNTPGVCSHLARAEMACNRVPVDTKASIKNVWVCFVWEKNSRINYVVIWLCFFPRSTAPYLRKIWIVLWINVIKNFLINYQQLLTISLYLYLLHKVDQSVVIQILYDEVGIYK